MESNRLYYNVRRICSTLIEELLPHGLKPNINPINLIRYTVAIEALYYSGRTRGAPEEVEGNA